MQQCSAFAASLQAPLSGSLLVFKSKDLAVLGPHFHRPVTSVAEAWLPLLSAGGLLFSILPSWVAACIHGAYLVPTGILVLGLIVRENALGIEPCHILPEAKFRTEPCREIGKK